MDNSDNIHIPWDIIAQSLAGQLTIDEEAQLKSWLSDSSNAKKFEQIKSLWDNKLESYHYFKEADENKSWEKLKIDLLKDEPYSREKHIVTGRFKYFLSIAAVIIGLIVIGTFYFQRNKDNLVYETFAGTEKNVILRDGSSITLKPFTKVVLSKNYNENERKILMISGEAFFKVIHRSEKPFKVIVGKTQVLDIGTSFTIKKEKKRIEVLVSAGKVEFSNTVSKEVKELKAGDKITFDVERESFSELQAIPETFGTKKLNFDNTTVYDVINSMQDIYHIQIVLVDQSLGARKITANLEGLSAENAVSVVCKIVGIEYSIEKGKYILKSN